MHHRLHPLLSHLHHLPLHRLLQTWPLQGRGHCQSDMSTLPSHSVHQVNEHDIHKMNNCNISPCQHIQLSAKDVLREDDRHLAIRHDLRSICRGIAQYVDPSIERREDGGSARPVIQEDLATHEKGHL